MRRRHRLAAALSIATCTALLTPAAWGYAIEVHKDFYDLAFASAPSRTVQGATADDLTALRRFFWERASGMNAEFKRRWPTFASFDAAAFKELLALNRGKSVVGIDRVPGDRPLDLRTVVREGSVDPDNDHRNQDRLFTRNGAVVLDPFGRAVPYDPRTTWFGGLTGIPSQFDAHGATLRTGKKGGGILTAFSHPEQFARPAVALGSAPEFSQTYTDLAMLARLRGGHGSEWLALTFGGNNMHGLQDLGNQIHCTVLGIPEFFLDAKKTYYKRKIRNMFHRRGEAPSTGFAAPTDPVTPDEVNAAMELIKAGKVDQVDPGVRFALGHEPKGQPSDVELGIAIIGNHHRLLEDFVESQTISAMRLRAAGRSAEIPPHIRALLERAERGDAAFEQACRQALAAAGIGGRKGSTEFARVIAEVMVQHSAPEAATIYRAIRKISLPGLKGEQFYDSQLGHDPLKFVTTTTGEHVDTIWELSGRAFARVVTILRLWDETFRDQCEDVPSGSAEALARADVVIERMVGRQLAYLAEAEKRRDEYLAEKVAEHAKVVADAAEGKGFLDRLRGLFGGR
jgi:hypothetical protein